MKYKIYHIIFKTVSGESREFFTTSRAYVLNISNIQLNKSIKLGSLDNYIRKINLLPYGMVLLETYDAYDFFQDEAYKLYGNMDNMCSKTIQHKYSKIVDNLIASPQSNFVR